MRRLSRLAVLRAILLGISQTPGAKITIEPTKTLLGKPNRLVTEIALEMGFSVTS